MTDPNAVTSQSAGGDPLGAPLVPEWVRNDLAGLRPEDIIVVPVNEGSRGVGVAVARVDMEALRLITVRGFASKPWVATKALHGIQRAARDRGMTVSLAPDFGLDDWTRVGLIETGFVEQPSAWVTYVFDIAAGLQTPWAKNFAAEPLGFTWLSEMDTDARTALLAESGFWGPQDDWDRCPVLFDGGGRPIAYVAFHSADEQVRIQWAWVEPSMRGRKLILRLSIQALAAMRERWGRSTLHFNVHSANTAMHSVTAAMGEAFLLRTYSESCWVWPGND